jgi:hypothetical protein
MTATIKKVRRAILPVKIPNRRQSRQGSRKSRLARQSVASSRLSTLGIVKAYEGVAQGMQTLNGTSKPLKISVGKGFRNWLAPANERRGVLMNSLRRQARSIFSLGNHKQDPINFDGINLPTSSTTPIYLPA